MLKKRIVVTGMGIVSPLGHEIDSFYARLLAGESAISLIPSMGEEYPTRFAGWIRDFDPEGYLDKKLARRVDPFIAYGIVAGKKALAASGISPETILDKTRAGILLCSGMGGMHMFNDNAHILQEKGPQRLSPFLIPFIITNMAGGLLAMDYGFMGPNYSISTACATGNNALIAAADHIRKGDADLMVAGGVEAALLPLGMAGFNACKALSERNEAPEKASRPWDKGRDGFVMSEGAGVLVLESLEHAQKRGAPILAEYLGGGVSCDAWHMTNPRPDGEGVALCIHNALNDAGIKAEQVDYINAHATSTPAGDIAEINAAKKVFKHPEKIVMNGTKSMLGHGLGAAGGFEAIVTVKALKTGHIHPTINLENPEEGLAFEIPVQAIQRPIQHAISNSFGFGGHNATVVFKKWNP